MTSTLMVRGTRWKIKFVKKVPGEPSYGLCDTETRTIYIEKGLDPDEALETLLHEYVHAVMYEVGLHEDLAKEIEHVVTVSISRDMTNNKGFFKSIFCKVKFP